MSENTNTLIMSGSFTEKTKSDEHPSPRDVADRLYGRSSSEQRMGRERREEIEARSKCHYSSHSPKSLQMRGSSRDRSGYSPHEVTMRLYGRSYQSQRVGRERRDEIDRARALSNARAPIRLSVSPPPLRVPALPKGSSVISARANDSLSPEEISTRLYGRSMRGQQAGRDRREKLQMRSTSLPRMILHCSSNTTAPYEESPFETVPSRPVSTRDTIERLYSRSLQHQEIGKVRRTEIDRQRGITSPMSSVRVRASSPTPQKRRQSYSASE